MIKIHTLVLYAVKFDENMLLGRGLRVAIPVNPYHTLKGRKIEGSHGIEPIWDRTHFLKIRLVVAWGGFYSYYNLQCIRLDKERKKYEKKFFCIQKTFNAIFYNGFNPVLGSIPSLPNML